MQPGRFALEAGVTLVNSARSQAQSGMREIALLTSAPAPEGVGYRELEAPGYVRARTSFGTFSARSRDGILRSHDPITFGPDVTGWPDALYMAVFDEQERALYSGRLRRVGGLPQPILLVPAAYIQLNSCPRLG
jgi:hypothetical protein